MNLFWEEIIEPLFEISKPKIILEIGSGRGRHTIEILKYCVKNDCNLHSIDPFPQFDLKEFNKKYGKYFTFYKDLSLNVLTKIEQCDAVLIYGDSNWYTVYNELLLIEKIAIKHNTFPLVLLHNVGWPYGRRDMYYNPENIPEEYRQAYEKEGTLSGQSKLVEEGGSNPIIYNSIDESSYKNGVLTAIEDFLKQTSLKLSFANISGLHGLGVIFQSDNTKVNNFLEDFKLNPTISAYFQLIDKMYVDNLTHLSKKEQQIKALNRGLAEKVGEKEEKIEALEQRIEAKRKEFVSLLNSIRYRLGTILIEGAKPSKGTFLLPFRLANLFYEGLRKKFVKNQVSLLKHRLLNLGFVERALLDLEKLVADSSEPFLQERAAWELALWHANKYSKESARRCLELLPIATKSEHSEERLRQATILEIECHDVLGDIDAGKEVIKNSLSSVPNADIYFAAANLETSISGRIDCINKALEISGISKISLDPLSNRHPYDGILSETKTRKNLQTKEKFPKVTVIMPIYNAEKTIHTALNSILAQTWTNLEVLVVNDCSTDNTVEIIKEYEKKDDRVKLIKAEVNQGPYVARNIGLKNATGDYVTCNDADDWSHPEKIELHAQRLNKNKKLFTVISKLVRSTNDLKINRRGNPGFYVQINVSSLMFRRKQLLETLGYWDSVRFGADSELYTRVKEVFGEKAIGNIEAVLSLARSTTSSLTENEKFGYHGYPMGARKEYQDSYMYYYSISKKTKYQFPQKTRPFPIPSVMYPDRETNFSSRTHFDIVLVSDFRKPDNAINIADEIKSHKKKGARIGLVQMADYDYLLSKGNRDIDKRIRGLIDGDYVQMLVYGEKITCAVLIVRDFCILQEKQRYIPEVKAEDIIVIANYTLEKDSDTKNLVYNIKQCSKHLQEYFGKTGVWYPVNSKVRNMLHKFHSNELRAITLATENWFNKIDEAMWKKTINPIQDKKTPVQGPTLTTTSNQDISVKADDEAIKLIDVKDLSSYSYTNTKGVAVIMPCVDTEKGIEAASILFRRAGIDCKILVVHDTLRQGFIKTLNDTALRVSTRYIVYLAEDAFPSRDWLRHAYDTLEKSGKGLLAFNDGKWRGRIAAFGMVNIDWVSSLYGGKIFYPGYNAHGADNELTVIARAQNMYEYNPECVLMEYDPYKDFIGSNPRDKEFFKKRFVEGFDGLVSIEKLQKLAKEYNVEWAPQ